jgi:hypothetical protein
MCNFIDVAVETTITTQAKPAYADLSLIHDIEPAQADFVCIAA